MKVGDYISVSIRGHIVPALIIAVHSFGTIDVQTSAGCFRVSGLDYLSKYWGKK